MPRVKRRCVGRWHQSRDPAPITTPSRARPRSYLLAHASLPAARRSRRCPRPSGPAPLTSSFAPAQSSSLLPDLRPRPAPIRPAPSTSPFVPASSTPERANSPAPSLSRRFTRRRHVGPLSPALAREVAKALVLAAQIQQGQASGKDSPNGVLQVSPLSSLPSEHLPADPVDLGAQPQRRRPVGFFS